VITLAASLNGTYADAGATCSDEVFGLMNDRIQTTALGGNIVDVAVPATYTYRYMCTNNAGRSADPGVRIIVVEDKQCPVCTLNGAASIIREASFPYVDAGAVCEDNIDGALTAVQTSTVNVAHAGTYTVSYDAVDKSNNKNCAQCVRIVTVKDTLKPVIALRYGGQLVHTSSVVGNIGVNGQANPSAIFGKDHLGRVTGKHGTPVDVGNPFLWGDKWVGLMAEQQHTSASVSTWAACGMLVASVVGLALLGWRSNSK